MQVGVCADAAADSRVGARRGVDKAKTQAENVEKMLARAETELNGSDATVVVTHGDNPKGAEELARPRRSGSRAAT